MSSGNMAGRPPILLGCDDAALANLLQDALSDVGYQTHWHRSGHAVLTALRDQPDRCLALLSFRWPPLNSRAVLHAIAQEERLVQRHGYVLLTALWDFLSAEERAFLQALGVPVVPKPFTLQQLLEVVVQASDRLTESASE